MWARSRNAICRNGGNDSGLSRAARQLFAAFVFAFITFPAASLAQQGMGARSKLPVINKITSNGPTRSAFTGSVQSLDRKLKVLNVTGGPGPTTAIFPLSKKTKISSISGQKLRLAALTPGTNVLVYYEQNAARRTVQQVIVLGPAASHTKKTPHAS